MLVLHVANCPSLLNTNSDRSTLLIRARAPEITLTPSLLAPGTPLSLRWLHNLFPNGGLVDDHNSKAVLVERIRRENLSPI